MSTHTNARPGRNEPCLCGSEKKYKHCCLAKDEKKAAAARAKAADEPETAPSEETPAPAARAPKPKTDQPWKTGSSTRGFVPRSRTPRKVGGG
jgi:SEC-C motif